MTFLPCLVRSSTTAGGVHSSSAIRCSTATWSSSPGRTRPNTVRAVAFDLKTFFTVVDKEPAEVQPSDVFDFLAHQRGDRTVVRMADRESGLSARTIARRLSSVSGFYGLTRSPEATPAWRSTRCPAACRRAGAAGGHEPSRWSVPRTPPRFSIPPRFSVCSERCAASGTGPWSWPWCWAACAAVRSSGSAWPTSSRFSSPTAVHRRRQGRSPAGGPDRQLVLRRRGRLPAHRTPEHIDGAGLRRPQGPPARPAAVGGGAR